jgi:hypothetical protein
MHAPSLGFLVLLALLLAAALVSDHRQQAPRRLKRRPVGPHPVVPPVPAGTDLRMRLARWLGAVARRLGREFYYWTVDEPDGPDASATKGFCLSEVPDNWYAYRVRAEDSVSPSDSVILLP